MISTVVSAVVVFLRLGGPQQLNDRQRLLQNSMSAKRMKRRSLALESLNLYADSRQTCSFCYVDDLVEGMICLMMLITAAVHDRRFDEFSIR